ncbi:U3 snoRNP protein [Onygenales sp. PD_10]|nr:U3 snoRNP protein [Onygenales sp. PD_10]
MACSVTELIQLLSSTPEAFLRPTSSLHTDWTATTKRFLDPLACDITNTQKRRLQGKRKRKDVSGSRGSHAQLLQLQEIHANGFTGRQIWEQANRVLKAAAQETAQELSLLRTLAEAETYSNKRARIDQHEGSNDEILAGSQADSDDASMNDLEDIADDEIADGPIGGEESMMDDSFSGSEQSIDIDTRPKTKVQNSAAKHVQFVEDPNKLNDGFFSIDQFNAQTALFEKKDAKGLQSDDEDDEEEPVNWDADPLALGQMDPEDDEDEENSVDGDAASEAGLSDAESDFDENGLGLPNGNTNSIKYADFFEPPPLKISQTQTRDSPQYETRAAEQDIDAGVERAIRNVQRDLFDDAMSDEEDSDDPSGTGSKSKEGSQSTHEKRRAKIMDEIRRLEATNVAKKEWMVSGEAKGADRPLNSLIEEDLEFERVGKPVPVISSEVSDDIEALIKRRILAKEFDELTRRQAFDTGSELHRNREKFILDDTKPQQSLAEMYENDHLRATDSAYVDKKDEKLKAEHEEITQLWNSINSQLDTLCSWHHRPKPPQANISVVTDVATITMEDVRPTAGNVTEASGRLAPQEIYTPGDEGKIRGETLLKNGASISKEEMSREAKLRHRKREKQKLKKTSAQPVREGKAAEKQKVVSELKKGGVKVIDKQGGIKDVYGNKVVSNENKGQAVLKL